MPDDRRCLGTARALSRHRGGWGEPGRTFAVGLGREARHAARLVHADGPDLGNTTAATPVGMGGRGRARADCPQRPPLGRRPRTDENDSTFVPYFVVGPAPCGRSAAAANVQEAELAERCGGVVEPDSPSDVVAEPDGPVGDAGRAGGSGGYVGQGLPSLGRVDVRSVGDVAGRPLSHGLSPGSRGSEVWSGRVETTRRTEVRRGSWSSDHGS